MENLQQRSPINSFSIASGAAGLSAFERELSLIGISKDVNILESSLANYINSLDKIDAARRKNSLLSKAREAMLGDYLNSVVVDNARILGDVDNLDDSAQILVTIRLAALDVCS